jgi:hypothetical protein
MPVAANAVESLAMHTANWWVWNRVEHIFHARHMSDMQLGMDHYCLSVVQTVFAACGLVP